MYVILNSAGLNLFVYLFLDVCVSACILCGWHAKWFIETVVVCTSLRRLAGELLTRLQPHSKELSSLGTRLGIVQNPARLWHYTTWPRTREHVCVGFGLLREREGK